jgi:gamma-glutamyl-gamma-aminobutyrate hydrolase PuuD
MTHKVAVLYSACYYGAYPFEDMAHKVESVKDSDQMVNPDSILVIWGGADINPKLYGHPTSKTTHCYDARDTLEWACIQRAIALGIPMIGVCRGAQMMCAAAGGFLIQDVYGHAGRHHMVETNDGRRFMTNSIHHQMLAGLEKVDHVLLASMPQAISHKYTYKNDLVYTPPAGFKEPEMVWFPKIKAMAIQWHPEGMAEDCEATQFVMEKWYEHAHTTAEA